MIFTDVRSRQTAAFSRLFFLFRWERLQSVPTVSFEDQVEVIPIPRLGLERRGLAVLVHKRKMFLQFTTGIRKYDKKLRDSVYETNVQSQIYAFETKMTGPSLNEIKARSFRRLRMILTHKHVDIFKKQDHITSDKREFQVVSQTGLGHASS